MANTAVAPSITAMNLYGASGGDGAAGVLTALPSDSSPFTRTSNTLGRYLVRGRSDRPQVAQSADTDSCMRRSPR